MSTIREESVAVESKRAELARVLASDLFARAPVLGHFLSYLCEKTFAGENNEIKEYSIAVDVFRRDPNFDQDSDSIVRVHANRLRKRLVEYYATVGSADPIQINIPIGQYVPSFEVRSVPEPVAPPVVEPAVEQSKAVGETRQSSRWRLLAILALVAIAALVVSGLIVLRNQRAAVARLEAEAQAAPDLPAGLPAGDEVRILAGGTHPYVDHSGKIWSADLYFTGGTSVRTSAQHVWRTQESLLYRNSRQGDFSYDIPLNPGIYEMRLHFVETYYGPEEMGSGGEGSRIMNVTGNGVPLLTNFDVLVDGGASRTADIKVFTNIGPASDGKLHLKFSSVYGGQAMVSAIEILPGLRGRIRPIRLATRTSPYYSIDSRWWSPDNYYKGGQLSESQEPAVGTDDPELYQTERWGNFSYSIPVPPGKYDLTLHFIERRFGPTNSKRPIQPARTAEAVDNGRIFNVFCNGKLVLTQLDILKQAGENHPITRTLSGIEPNAQGKIVLDFIPVHDYATITAIEVIPKG